MELTGFLPTIKRWWWALLLAALVAGLVSSAVASRISPTYEARVRLLVGPINTDYNTLRASAQLTQTYADLVASKPVLEATIGSLALAVEPSDLRDRIRPTANDVSRVLTVRVRDGDAGRSALIATVLAEELVKLSSNAPAQQAGILTIIDGADPPNGPVEPQKSLIVVLGALAGLLGALALVVLVDRLNDNVRSERDLASLAGVDLLGTVTRRSHRSPLGADATGGPTGAALRLIAAKVFFADGPRPVRSVVVTQARDGDGGGELAVNLAAAMAASGWRPLLVDADHDRGEATAVLGLDGRPGLGDLLEGRDVDRQALGALGIEVLPHGTTPGSVLLQPATAEGTLADLMQDADIVVLSVGTVGTSAAGMIWTQVADAVVLVAQRDRTSRQEVAQAADNLRGARARLVGTVLVERRWWLGTLGRRARPQAAPPDAGRPDASSNGARPGRGVVVEAESR